MKTPLVCSSRPRRLAFAFGCFVALLMSVRAADDDRAVRNLAIFARVYGYVRYFHPSDEAVKVDWDKFAVLGAEQVRGAGSDIEAAAAIRRLFLPIAPSLQLVANGTPLAAFATPKPEARLTFWQYRGIKLEDRPNAYSHRRVIIGGADDRAPIFQPATAPEPIIVKVSENLWFALPSALSVGEDNATLGGDAKAFAALQKELEPLDVKSLTYTDWRLRVAAVIETWNIFQHFHPYLTLVKADWDAALATALRSALRDADDTCFYQTLMAMIAVSHDGHGYVYAKLPDIGWLPARLAVVESQLVVTGVEENSLLQTGDVIERFNAQPAMEALHEIEAMTPGSPQLRTYRALNQFAGNPGDVAKLEVVRAGNRLAVEVPLKSGRRPYFFSPIGEYKSPTIEEVRPGIFHVSIFACDRETLEKNLATLAHARGVIFDERSGGVRDWGKKTPIQPHQDIIPHLITTTVQASPMLVPQITRPDRQGWSYSESTWPVKPKAPLFMGRILFINEPSCVSYGETCMAMIADYKLATLVGEPTAGCNGNANFIPLPGGFRVMWTGMDVRKHDRSAFYNIGFVPDVPVTRTLAGIRAGRDEDLEMAIKVIEADSHPKS